MFADRTNWDLTANPLSEALAEHKKLAKPLFDLTASNPTECGFEYDAGRILQSLASPEALSYRPDPKGLELSRRAVAKYYAEHDVTLDSEDVLLTTSTSEAYSFVFRLLCNPSDEVLAPVPSYPLFDFLADIQDVRLSPYPLLYDHNWQIDFYALERLITPRTRAVIVVHLNNPTGHFTKRDEMETLNTICSKHSLALIADEVFLDFSRDDKPSSFAANRNVLTFTLSGLSKIAGLPQLKAAWLVASGPAEIKTQAVARLEIIADTYLSMNAPVQLAMPSLLAERGYFQRQVAARIQKNLDELDRQLARQKSCSRLIVEGGWYAILRVPAAQTDEETAIKALKENGVYVHPGNFYGFPGGGFLVVSLITREDEFACGVARLLSSI